MEYQTQSDIQPTNLHPQIPELRPQNTSKIIAHIVLGLCLFAAFVFFGIQIGRNQRTNVHSIIEQPTTSPTRTVIYSTDMPMMPNPTAADIQEQIAFQGWLSITWGDGFRDYDKKKISVTIYTVSNGTQEYKLLPSKEVPSLFEFDKKEVQVTGVKTEAPDTIMVNSIKVIRSN